MSDELFQHLKDHSAYIFMACWALQDEGIAVVHKLVTPLYDATQRIIIVLAHLPTKAII
jgi:hypothetical protein